MNKGILILTIFFIVVVLSAGAFYLFFYEADGDDTREATQEENQVTTTTTESASNEEETDDEATDGCQKGIVCLEAGKVPSLPTITLGKSEVYAAKPTEDPEDPEDPEEDPEEPQDEVKENTPQNILIANKDFRIWSILWVTEKAQIGYVKYGTVKDDLSKEAFDDREEDVYDPKERFTHHVTLTNTESDLEVENLVLYFIIVSGDEEFGNEEEPYEYENVSLTSSPSTPLSISVAASPLVDEYKEDYIVIARQVDSDKNFSSEVSDVFKETGGSELVIGIARDEAMSSYFSSSSSNEIDVKVYGPDSHTGYAEGITLSTLETEILNVQLSKTGYAGDIFGSSSGSNYTLDDKFPEADTEGEEDLPQTGIEDSWLFTSSFGLIILLLGLGCAVLFIPWNYKKLWERKVVDDIDWY